MDEIIKLLIITGPVGVGKTKTADAVSDCLSSKKIAHAVIDMDSLRWAYPRPDDDPFHSKLGYKNLAVIWPQYYDLGVRHVIIPCVIENDDEVAAFNRAIPRAQIMVIRLTASIATLYQRLEERETSDSVAWYKNRAIELDQQLTKKNIGDSIISTETKTIGEVAREVVDQWIGER